MKKLFGITCANITPMTPSGEIDLSSLSRLTRHLTKNGIDGIYPCGTNGEALLMTTKELQAVASAVVKENAGCASVYIQCASGRPADTLENVQFAKSSGADGAGVMTPIFFSCDELALKLYYDEVCRTAGQMPLYIYNIPKHSSNDIPAKLFGKLFDEHQNILGIKNSMADLKRIQAYLTAPKRAYPDVLIGSDSLIISALALGCAGAISGPCAVFTKWYKEIYDNFIKGELVAAREAQRKVVRISQSIAGIPQIPAIKAMLKMMGVIDHDTCRSPFRPLTKEELTTLDHALQIYTREA